MPSGDRFTADAVLVAGLAAGRRVADVAIEAGVSERTIWRRLNDPAFTARVQSAREQMIQTTAATLSQAASVAVTTLVDLMENSGSDIARLGAAKAVLELGAKYREMSDLERRISELERTAALATLRRIGP